MGTADFLCEKGVKDVTPVDMLEKPPVPSISGQGTMLHMRLGAAGSKLLFNTKVKRIDDSAVIVSTSGKKTPHQAGYHCCRD